jgi:transitional endoplasmic reticulum ATPase
MSTTTRRGTGKGSVATPQLGPSAVAQLLEALVKDSKQGEYDRAHLDTEVEYKGRKIILPGDPTPMPIPQAIEVLTSMHEESEQDVSISEVIRGAHYSDGQVAFSDAMEEVFGWTKATTVRTFFGDIHPTFVDIPIGLNESRRVIVGRFTMPNVPGYVETQPTRDEDGLWVLQITGKTKRKFQFMFEALAEATRRRVREKSIYKNKAFELVFDSDNTVSSNPPKFIDVSGNETPIFSRQTEQAIKANILTIIEQTERCRRMGVPIKRGVLLEGPYGTGKTLVSRQTGQTCLNNGWTFIVIRKAENVAPAIEFARRFQPACVFVEDIDREMGGDERDAEMDHILNTMDGVDSKNSDVMVVFTSNHADIINQAMLRPGRLDAVITIDPPDAEAALRLAKVYAKGLWSDEEDYSVIGEEMAGKSAAVIREVVERAKLYALGEVPDGQDFHLTASALGDSVATMNRQLELLNPKVDEPSTAGEQFLDAIAERVHSRLSLTDLEAAAQGASNLTRSVEQAVSAATSAARYASATNETIQEIEAASGKVAKQVGEIHREVV